MEDGRYQSEVIVWHEVAELVKVFMPEKEMSLPQKAMFAIVYLLKRLHEAEYLLRKVEKQDWRNWDDIITPITEYLTRPQAQVIDVFIDFQMKEQKMKEKLEETLKLLQDERDVTKYWTDQYVALVESSGAHIDASIIAPKEKSNEQH